MSRKQYNKEFKIAAVKLVQDDHMKIVEVSRLLQLSQSALYRWIQEYEEYGDNAVAEAQFKIIKTEFVKPRRFETLVQLELELEAYVYWFNNKRIHSTLDYLSPVEYRMTYSL